MLAVIIFYMMSTIVFATDTAAPNPASYKGNSNVGTSGIENIGNQVITIVSVVGSVVSVVILVVLGLKYMMGSAEEKAEYKKTLIPYLVGACLVFAASAIAGIVFGFAQNLG